MIPNAHTAKALDCHSHDGTSCEVSNDKQTSRLCTLNSRGLNQEISKVRRVKFLDTSFHPGFVIKPLQPVWIDKDRAARDEVASKKEINQFVSRRPVFLKPGQNTKFTYPSRLTKLDYELTRHKTLGMPNTFTMLVPEFLKKLPIPCPEPAHVDLDGEGSDSDELKEDIVNPEEPHIEELILWHNGEIGENEHFISVDRHLCKFLRPHQREGVQFMFECLMGLRNFSGNGCILADDMGLGKTLQSIAVMWTLLEQGKLKGKGGEVRRCMIVCPTSLVTNWEDEIQKWLLGRCKCIALSESSREQVVSGINLYLSSPLYKVLIVSYDTFRLHETRFGGANANKSCDLLICDEAHRLKNGETATSRALSGLKCRKRVLLSGTPMQNDLEEFYAMVDFTNPGVLGDQSYFRRNFLGPILVGREPDATNGQKEKAQKCQNEMSIIVSNFILRRTNTLNAKHLPPKLVQVVACRLTDVQYQIYHQLLHSKEVRHILDGKQSNILSSIGAMQKLCNHPALLIEGASGGKKGSKAGSVGAQTLAEEVLAMLPRADSAKRSRSVNPELSGKMETLYRLMDAMRRFGNDRIVVVSNYTSALDLIGKMCRENRWPFCRLDGSTAGKKRKSLVAGFNDPTTDNFAFLLSSKAGGCGLNLIGGNRLVLFDPDWNPAVDKQAAARVWRDGQKKKCFVYRFISTGTIEEKIFQRQLSKEGLQSIVDDQAEVNSLSSKDLRNLFKLNSSTPCDTHDKLRCTRCNMGEALAAAEEDESRALHIALPKQLALCKTLLDQIRTLPEAEKFNSPGLLHLDPLGQALAPGVFEERCGEIIDLEEISLRLEKSIDTLHLRDPSEKFLLQSKGVSGSFYSTAGGIPAFAKDMNTAIGVPERIWGKDIKPNYLVYASRNLLQQFNNRWKDLVPVLMSIKEDARREVLASHQVADVGAESTDKSISINRYQVQLGMPKEEDLNNWSHHFSTDSVDDPVFRSAMAGTSNSIVSFIFGLEVTWDLLQTQAAKEEEEQEMKNGNDTDEHSDSALSEDDENSGDRFNTNHAPQILSSDRPERVVNCKNTTSIRPDKEAIEPQHSIGKRGKTRESGEMESLAASRKRRNVGPPKSNVEESKFLAESDQEIISLLSSDD